MLKIAAHAEAYSNHPIAKSIVSAYGGPISYDLIDGHTEYSGNGIVAYIKKIKIAIGTLDFLREQGTEVPDEKADDLTVYMSIGDIYAGRITLSDAVKEDSAAAIKDLADAGVEHVSMLTGDSAEIGSKLAKAVGIKEYFAECLPEDKVTRVRELKNRTGGKGTLVFVGDGINDAPVLTAADVGIAMGGLGSDAAVEAAEVVIMDDSPRKVAAAIHVSRNTIRIVYQNVILALGVKLIIMALGVAGISTLWFAVVADVGVALGTVLNSIRAFYIRHTKVK
jgi:Cd2+/Zn2+-exporting ATPase